VGGHALAALATTIRPRIGMGGCPPARLSGGRGSVTLDARQGPSRRRARPRRGLRGLELPRSESPLDADILGPGARTKCDRNAEQNGGRPAHQREQPNDRHGYGPSDETGNKWRAPGLGRVNEFQAFTHEAARRNKSECCGGQGRRKCDDVEHGFSGSEAASGTTAAARQGFIGDGRPSRRFKNAIALRYNAMFTLRVSRHDRGDTVLAECESACVPARGEVLQLDTIDRDGEQVRPSTMWRVVSVTLHVPSLASYRPKDGSPQSVQLVEVAVLPDVAVLHDLSSAAQEILSESRM